jgi:lipopolysaccharide export system permease protein
MKLRSYLTKEIITTFLAVICVVLAIAVSHKFVRLIAQAASGQLPADILFKLLISYMPDLLALLIPIALFLAILLSYSRCFVEQEMTALFACGVGWKQPLFIAVRLGLVAMLLVGSLTLLFNPLAASYREKLTYDQGPMLLVQTVSPGRFHGFYDDRLVFYVEDLNQDRNHLKQIFIAEQPNKAQTGSQNWSVLTAKEGQLTVSRETGQTYVNLIDGKRYDGHPGERDYSVVTFDGYRRLIQETQSPEGLYYHRNMPTKMLIDNPMPSNQAELQWRLSLALAAPLLAFLAVPMSQVPPRKGKFGRIFIAIIACIIYFNLITMSKRWVGSGAVPGFIGVWWVHATLFMVATTWLLAVSGRLKQFFAFITRRHSQ